MLVYERATGIAWVGRRPVRLGTDNMVAVDQADSSPTVVATLRIPAELAFERAVCNLDAGAEIHDSLHDVASAHSRTPHVPDPVKLTLTHVWSSRGRY